mmetsp:Transcript_31424/g.63864  ORF Transcript_31424/g.63864 Transcript_31424/m.63864 type:complete len:386 (-) Transcript_31424:2967-4124(-)
MKFFSFMTMMVAGLTVPSVAAVDCNACDDDCEWHRVDCHAKRALCKSTAGTFEVITDSIEAACANDPSRMEARGLISEAKDLLVSKNLFSRSEVDSVEYRFCSYLGDFAGGMAPSKGKVLLHTDYVSSSKSDLAHLLSHELTHTRQYHRWGTDGFNCRYAEALASGNGFGKSNRIEKEAYDFDEGAQKCIYNDIGCPTKKLRNYHGGCDSVHKSRTPECVSAMNRFCNEKCTHCGGVSQEVGNGVFGVACFASNAHIVYLQDLQTHHSSCHAGASQSNECASAIHRWCGANGHGSVGIAQELGSDHFLLRCFGATWYGDVSIQDLRNQHHGCDNVGKGNTADCVSAMHRWCGANNKGTQGLAQELGNGVIGVACFDSEWYGDVAV